MPTDPLTGALPYTSLQRNKRRALPHWTMSGATYYITFCLGEGQLNDAEISLIIRHIQQGDPRYYTLMAATIMPDHVHLLLTPQPGVNIPRIMKGMKGSLARQINLLCNSFGSLWQADWHDRIMRDDTELNEKLQYMLNNPVKAGLVEDGWTYSGWYCRG